MGRVAGQVFFMMLFLATIIFKMHPLIKAEELVVLPPPFGNVIFNISNITRSSVPPQKWILDDDSAVKKIKFKQVRLPCNSSYFSLQIFCYTQRNICADFCAPDQPLQLDLKGRLEILMNWSQSEIFQHGFVLLFDYEFQCTTDCSRTITMARDVSNIIKSPSVLNYRNCRCVWNIQVRDDNYVVKAEFITLNLAKEKNGKCIDQVLLIDVDGGTTSGPYCGFILPKFVKTSKNNLRVVYTTRNLEPSGEFELLISNEKKDNDLAGLQSVAAVLGAISFSVFIGLMLCSVLYKRWSRGRSDNDSRVEGGNNEDDYDDAIRRSAPPSYNKVLAAPEDYPSTPQASPILTRTLPTVDPPDYPGINDARASFHDATMDMEPRSRQNSLVEVEMMNVPLPTYDVVSESEDDWFSVPRKSHLKSKLVGKNGLPPTYSAVTSEGSENEIGESSHNRDNRNKNRTSRSKRSSTSSIRNAKSNHVDSDSDSDGEQTVERETRRKRASNLNFTSPPLSDLPMISSDSEGEIEELRMVTVPVQIENERPSSPNLLEVPTENHIKPKINRSRSYTELARHAIINSIERNGRTASSSPETRPRSGSLSIPCTRVRLSYGDDSSISFGTNRTNNLPDRSDDPDV